MKNCSKFKKESGYALLTILALFSLSLVIISGLLRSSTNNAKLQNVVNLNNVRYYDVERSIGQVTAWFQDNSKYLTPLFKHSSFGSRFTTGSPVVGTNDGVNFSVPTQVKSVSNPNESIILSNNETEVSGSPIFGTTNFPNLVVHNDDPLLTKNIVDEFKNLFPNADNGGVNIRIVLISAVSNEDSDYNPIFRIDAITGNDPDRGTHLYSYVNGEYTNNGSAGIEEPTIGTGTPSGNTAGFYGHNGVTIGGSSWCKSRAFSYNGTTWSMNPITSNCLVQSQAVVDLFGGGTKVYGSVKTNGSITSTSKITGNNADGCAGSDCHTAMLTKETNAWLTDGTCATFPNITISSNTNLSAGCYGTVTISNRTLTLNDTSGNYYIQSLNFSGGQAKLQVNPGVLPAGYSPTNYAPYADTSVTPNVIKAENPYDIKMYVDEIVGGKINGQNVVNGNFAPHLLKFVYTGNSTLTLNGTATMRAHIYAPYATVSYIGNFVYYGAVNANSIISSGTADLYSDDVYTEGAIIAGEAVAGDPIENDNISFRITKILQRYR